MPEFEIIILAYFFSQQSQQMQNHIIDQIIASRRSVFPEMYTSAPIDDEIILQVIENATWAPNHKLTEPWRFRIFKGEALNKLSEFLGNHYRENTPSDSFSELKFKKTIEKPLRSACVIAICYQKDQLNRVPEEEELIAMGAAIQNMWLTCSSYGIGCYLSTPSVIHSLGKLFEMQEGERCLGLFYMGWKKDGELFSKRADLRSKLSWIL